MNNANNPVIGYKAAELAADTHVEIRFDAAAWVRAHRPRYGKAILVRRIMIAAAENGLLGEKKVSYGRGSLSTGEAMPNYRALVEQAGGTIIPLGTAAGAWS